MRDKTCLMIPGPTPVPESVLLDMAKHPIGHRSKEFSAILEEVYADLEFYSLMKKLPSKDKKFMQSPLKSVLPKAPFARL